MSIFQSHSYQPHAFIKDSKLVLYEFSASQVEAIRDIAFQDEEAWPTPQGSEIQQWFRLATQGPNVYRSLSTNGRLNTRFCGWKKGAKFIPDNLFFHTVDTSRMLPMSLADFRIQWYAHPDTWKRIDNGKLPNGVPGNPRDFLLSLRLTSIIFPLLVMRNMHDYGGGDIPIIFVDWAAEQIDRAFAYWVEMSKGELSDEEQVDKFHECESGFPFGLGPCFFQVDLLLRSLWSDIKADYVPRFIVFVPMNSKYLVRTLFTDPSYVPPEELTSVFPRTCGAPKCNDPDCAVFDFSASRSLISGATLVRQDKFPKKTVRCNFWTCGVVEQCGYSGRSVFLQCQRCKEVVYCCKEHQTFDWKTHKRVCETPS